MHVRVPSLLRLGSINAYVKVLDDCPDLLPFIHALAPGTPVVWCDSARHHPATGRWSLLGCDPWLSLMARGHQIELRTTASTTTYSEHPLSALRQVLDRYHIPSCAQPHGRAIGLMGFLTYDVNRWIEQLPDPQPSVSKLPEMLWFGMRLCVLVDHLQGRTRLLAIVDPHSPQLLAKREACDRLAWATEILTRRCGEQSSQKSDPHPVVSGGRDDRLQEVPGEHSSLQAACSQSQFESMVLSVLEEIGAGEIFQANVSQRFGMRWREPTVPLYAALRRINPSPFACYLSWGQLSVVCSSPERLVRVQEGRVDTRPIAGTRPRGATPPEDVLNGLDLLLSEKERAEHTMLVDLARNDLGRICAPGSVTVDEFMTLEEYSHVIHIVSDVSGVLQRSADTVDVIQAVFPGGTITGCPKVRCMQILRAVEPVARGLYTGSLGYLGFDGTMDLNIAIRTMVVDAGQLSFHVGAGIVADSDPEREYRETLAKAAALVSALRVVSPKEQRVGQPEIPRAADKLAGRVKCETSFLGSGSV